jgi:hypothetical protein
VKVTLHAFVLDRADPWRSIGLGETRDVDAGCEEFGDPTIEHMVRRNAEEAGGGESFEKGGLVFLHRWTYQPE